jgi:hypothetical protein
MDPVGCFIGVTVVLVVLISIVACRNQETFVSSLAPAAETSGLYFTFHRACEPQLTRCRIKTPFGHDYYFCSNKKDCKLKNVVGEPMEEPVPWFQRFL